MRLECRNCKERVPEHEMTMSLCYDCYEKEVKFNAEELPKILANIGPKRPALEAYQRFTQSLLEQQGDSHESSPDANPATGIPYGDMD